ncbi:MAG: hypothetical protein HY304_01120 [candidate division Zixibacteria bacterium]|nr:hypothetical protein [candidate division Zixibacteria bacterium]
MVLQISPAQFGQGGPLADKDYPDYRSILIHVVACIHVYVDYIEDGLDSEDRGRRKHDYDCSTPAASVQSMWVAFERTATMLGRIKHYSEEDMEKVKFPTRWSQGYDIEQMLEHAIVHILRHRRQIERWQKAASV